MLAFLAMLCYNSKANHTQSYFYYECGCQNPL